MRPKGCGRIIARRDGTLWIAYRDATGRMARECTHGRSWLTAERMLQRRIVAIAYPSGPPPGDGAGVEEAAELFRLHGGGRSTWKFTYAPSIRRLREALPGPLARITEEQVSAFLEKRRGVVVASVYEVDRSTALRLWREAWRAGWVFDVPRCLQEGSAHVSRKALGSGVSAS